MPVSKNCNHRGHFCFPQATFFGAVTRLENHRLLFFWAASRVSNDGDCQQLQKWQNLASLETSKRLYFSMPTKQIVAFKEHNKQRPFSNYVDSQNTVTWSVLENKQQCLSALFQDMYFPVIGQVSFWSVTYFLFQKYTVYTYHYT